MHNPSDPIQEKCPNITQVSVVLMRAAGYIDWYFYFFSFPDLDFFSIL